MGNPNMQKGMPSVNPKGRPTSVFQSLSDRRSHFLETLSRSEIIRLGDDDKELDKYSSFDAKVLIGLSEALKRTSADKLDASKEREKLYDRELGKPGQPIIHQGDSENPLITQTIEIGKELADMLTLEQMETLRQKILAKSQSGAT